MLKLYHINAGTLRVLLIAYLPVLNAGCNSRCLQTSEALAPLSDAFVRHNALVPVCPSCKSRYTVGTLQLGGFHLNVIHIIVHWISMNNEYDAKMWLCPASHTSSAKSRIDPNPRDANFHSTKPIPVGISAHCISRPSHVVGFSSTEDAAGAIQNRKNTNGSTNQPVGCQVCKSLQEATRRDAFRAK